MIVAVTVNRTLRNAIDAYDEDNAVDYPTGVRFAARIDTAGDDTVEMELTTANGAQRYFAGIDFMACLGLIGMGDEFASVDHSLKLLQSSDALISFDDLHHSDGRPLTESEKASYHVKIPVENTVGTYGARWINGVWRASETPVRESGESGDTTTRISRDSSSPNVGPRVVLSARLVRARLGQ